MTENLPLILQNTENLNNILNLVKILPIVSGKDYCEISRITGNNTSSLTFPIEDEFVGKTIDSILILTDQSLELPRITNTITVSNTEDTLTERYPHCFYYSNSQRYGY